MTEFIFRSFELLLGSVGETDCPRLTICLRDENVLRFLCIFVWKFACLKQVLKHDNSVGCIDVINIERSCSRSKFINISLLMAPVSSSRNLN